MDKKVTSQDARDQVLYEKIMSVIGNRDVSNTNFEKELKYIAREALVVEIATEYAKNKPLLVPVEKQFCNQMYQEISNAPSVTVLVGQRSVDISVLDKEDEFVKFIQREIELQIRTLMADASRFEDDLSALTKRVGELRNMSFGPNEVKRKDVIALGKIVTGLRELNNHKNLTQKNAAKIYEVYSQLSLKKMELEGLDFSE